MNKPKKNNVVNFPSNTSEIEREVEAILFAAAEPLDIETIESRISKKTKVLKILEKLQQIYSKRGINLYISLSLFPSLILFLIKILKSFAKGASDSSID